MEKRLIIKTKTMNKIKIKDKVSELLDFITKQDQRTTNVNMQLSVMVLDKINLNKNLTKYEIIVKISCIFDLNCDYGDGYFIAENIYEGLHNFTVKEIIIIEHLIGKKLIKL